MANLREDEKRMFQIVGLQSFNGSFKPSSILCKLICLDEQKLRAAHSAHWNLDAWNTTVVLAYFFTKLKHLEGDWELIAEKSKAWLSLHYSNESEEMFQKAVELLN